MVDFHNKELISVRYKQDLSWSHYSIDFYDYDMVQAGPH